MIAAPAPARVEVALASTRSHFSVSEPVELAVLAEGDAAGDAALPLELRHADGSILRIEIPSASKPPSPSRIVTLRPGLLKPGDYTASVRPPASGPTVTSPGADPAAGASSASPDDSSIRTVAFHVYPSEHPNPAFTAAWDQTAGSWEVTKAKGGWMYFSSDLVSLHPRPPAPNDLAESHVAARMKPYAMTILGGGHQLDLDLHNDWGDAWVQRAIAWRTGLAALSNRIYPMAGLHAYDEPGLTWWPTTERAGYPADINPFSVPHQIDEFGRIAGRRLPEGPFAYTGPKYRSMMDDWLAFMEMRMKYIEQAWEAVVWAAGAVHPGFAVLNQVSGSYAPGDVTDGVDSRQNRPFSIVGGHGGYSDGITGSAFPIRSAESFRGYTWDRPHYLLPMWFIDTSAGLRSGIWMPWVTKLEGMMFTPELDYSLANAKNSVFATMGVFEIAEVNRRLAMVGGVMNRLPKSLSPVAVLHSHRQAAADIADRNAPEATGGPYASPHNDAVSACFWRTVDAGIVPNWIDEAEAVEKGVPFLSRWRVIFCPALSTASPAFQKVLEAYVEKGGRLVQFAADPLAIRGATRADHSFGDIARRYAEITRDPPDPAPNTDLEWFRWFAGFAPTFEADLKSWIGPLRFSVANPDVLLGAHAAGAATYLLMANNAQDARNPRGVKHEPASVSTTVHLPREGVVYDLFRGGEVAAANGQAPLRLAPGDGACWLHLAEPPGPLKLSVRIETASSDSRSDGRSDARSDGRAEDGGTGRSGRAGESTGGRPGGRPPEIVGGAGAGPESAPSAGVALRIEVNRGKAGYLPFRLRIIDPSGRRIDELYRATSPDGGTTRFTLTYPLGANALPGDWIVEAWEWLTGSTATETASVKIPGSGSWASVETDGVSIYFDDARRIEDLFAGRPLEPDYRRLGADASRVFGLDPKRFAIFGPDTDAVKLADALRKKGMTAAVNPPHPIEPMVREPGRGGAGPTFGLDNFESIHAHSIVLPDHPLAGESMRRGHINRPVTAAFPGPGRAFIQWGMGCYQAGWQNVFVFGDTAAGLDWLLRAIDGRTAETAASLTVTPVTPAAKPPPDASKPLSDASKPPAVPITAPAAPPAPSLSVFTPGSSIRLLDAPVGVGASLDGKNTLVALHDGSVESYNAAGLLAWRVNPLMEAHHMAISPQGGRIAVAGYPGLLILNTVNGATLGGYRTASSPRRGGLTSDHEMMLQTAWDSDGAVAAACWAKRLPDGTDIAIVNSNGMLVDELTGVTENIRGIAFIPGADILLVGGDRLTAVDVLEGVVLWSNEIAGAQSFSFDMEKRIGAAGGWGRRAGVFSLSDGRLLRSATFEGIVGGTAFLPGGDLAVAVWGGTRPLQRLRASDGGTEPLFRSEFGFQSVAWSGKLGRLLAAEQGGRLWLLDPDGKPAGLLDDGGTTVSAMTPAADAGSADAAWIVGRFDRTVQRVELR